jgi:streptogramin lyase
MKLPLVPFFLLVLLGTASGAGQTFTEFPLPASAGYGPIGITAGPDGNVWFTVYAPGAPGIGRITPEGLITTFTIPTSRSQPLEITTGPDGNLWFTEIAVHANRIGRITPSGSFAEFPIPTARCVPNGIATGPDGALWFTEYAGNKIGRITTSGAITEFVVPTSTLLEKIVAGPDGALWFVERSANKIGRITTSGAITEFPIPTPFSRPLYIATGPDGALWFGESGANRIGRITTWGEITEFPIPTPASELGGIVAGIDGNLYFTESEGNRIGRITTSGTITEFPIPTSGSLSGSGGIALGPDGAIWFVEFGANKIGRFSIGPLTEPGPVSVTLPAAASLHGAPPTFFHSDVSVFNPSAAQTATVTARYRCFTGACGNAVQTFTVPPRQMRVFEDIVGTLFGAAETGGAVEFSGNVLVDSRLYTPSRPAPTVGMYVPGLSPGEAHAEAVVTSLSYSANLSTGFRTNVGVYNGNDVAQTVTFTLFNPQGVQIGQAVQAVPARTPLQINNIAGFVGIATDVPKFYCVVRGDGTSKNYVYAAVLDNQSQDLIFVKGAESRPP